MEVVWLDRGLGWDWCPGVKLADRPAQPQVASSKSVGGRAERLPSHRRHGEAELNRV